MSLSFSLEQTEAQPPQAWMVSIPSKVAEGQEHFGEETEADMGQGQCALRLPESPSSTQADVAHQINALEGSEAKNPAGERTGVGSSKRRHREEEDFFPC